MTSSSPAAPLPDDQFQERFHAKNRKFGRLTREHEHEFTEDFFFVQMADCQLGFIEDNKCWEKDKILLRKAVERINELKPRFAILCGDMTHAFPNEHELYDQQVADYKAIVRRVDPSIPLICVCGNHDAFDRPTPESLATFERHYGEHFFTFWCGGVQCIVLNSSLYFDPSGAPKKFEEQRSFLREVLEGEDEPVHRLVFAHIPPFLRDPDEPDQWFNIPKKRRIPLLEQLHRANVTACFFGHYHGNVLTNYKGMPLIVTTAIGWQRGTDTHGFRVVNVTNSAVSSDFVKLDESIRLNLGAPTKPYAP